ncbi:hypothetical protein SDC9_209159 [bioreactor metagenome]|uniref:Uncharacterized protein n=1 Tax=bioreactor metagenome TaxID=1076179 RepID=A0A645JE11_9ZZZZ
MHPVAETPIQIIVEIASSAVIHPVESAVETEFPVEQSACPAAAFVEPAGHIVIVEGDFPAFGLCFANIVS